MSTGLIALLDDVMALAKVAAASLDDAAGQAARAGAKAVGVVIDDAAVTPTYVHGFAASRELPIVGRIAMGSVRNKALYLLPAALLLSWLAPWAITPLLMAGGAYLCFEGAEKVWSAVRGHQAAHDEAATPAGDMEDAKVRSAIQTDLILSAEIMAVTLGSVEDLALWVQAAVLAVVGLGITALVYGVVAVLVKADDIGLALVRQERPTSVMLRLGRRLGPGGPNRFDRAMRPATRAVGRLLVIGMPRLLQGLSVVGTAAMLWVGGGILMHGLEALGMGAPAHALEDDAALAASHVASHLPGIAAAVEWIVTASVSAVIGAGVGSVAIGAVAVGAAAVSALRRTVGGRH